MGYKFIYVMAVTSMIFAFAFFSFGFLSPTSVYVGVPVGILAGLVGSSCLGIANTLKDQEQRLKRLEDAS